MFKFRPIAPKPTGGEAVTGGVLQERGNISTRNGRAKRKYVRVRRRRRQNSNQCKKRRRKSEPSKESGNEDGPSAKSMVTLQLFPVSNENISSRGFLHNLEDGDEKIQDDVLDHDKMVCLCQQLGGWREMLDHSEGKRVELVESKNNVTRTLHGKSQGLYADAEISSSVAREAAHLEGNPYEWKSTARESESWVIIECFTDAIMEGLGFSDKEKFTHLHIDRNPGFVSDISNNVVWVNDAYKKMVLGEENQELAAEFRVYLLTKEKNMPYFLPEFACRVRVEYNLNGRKCTRTVPCDVWKMEFGGFAWKMDFKAALSLGL